jgi:hypothetical protein
MVVSTETRRSLAKGCPGVTRILTGSRCTILVMIEVLREMLRRTQPMVDETVVVSLYRIPGSTSGIAAAIDNDSFGSSGHEDVLIQIS